MTFYEKIKSMTQEELIVFFINEMIDYHCDNCPAYSQICSNNPAYFNDVDNYSCYEALKKWLEKEYIE